MAGQSSQLWFPSPSLISPNGSSRPSLARRFAVSPSAVRQCKSFTRERQSLRPPHIRWFGCQEMYLFVCFNGRQKFWINYDGSLEFRVWLWEMYICLFVPVTDYSFRKDVFSNNFKGVRTNNHLFNLHPEKWFEGYPVKSTQLFIRCHLIFLG